MADVKTLLKTYLDLERLMIALDESDDPAADDLRDAMDPLWYRLGEEERAFLNSRSDTQIGADEPQPFEPFGEKEADIDRAGRLVLKHGLAA